jgi:hypothetical protein
MDFVVLLALGGGLFATLTFIHFAVDWIFQSHAEAVVKHNNPKIRAKHCAIYTLGFVPLLSVFAWVGALTLMQFGICVAVLFISHFVEDTYLPVFYWAKYIRKPPVMFSTFVPKHHPDGSITSELDHKKGFGLFVETPIGKILMISIDQIIHLTFLWVIVYFVLANFVK